MSKKILKNTTAQEIDLINIGLVISANSQVEIDERDYLLLASVDSLSELNSYIESSEIIVNDGTEDLPIEEAKNYLKYPHHAENIRFDNTSNGFLSKNAQDAIEEARNTVVGALFNLSFEEYGSAVNEWLEHSGDGKNSDRSPAVIPFPCELRAITFTNSDNDSDTNIQVWKSPVNQGNSREMVYELQLRNTRTGYKNDIIGVDFIPGDKVGIYLEDAGVNPDNVVVTLYFKINNEISGEGTEQWSGNLSNGSIITIEVGV